MGMYLKHCSRCQRDFYDDVSWRAHQASGCPGKKPPVGEVDHQSKPVSPTAVVAEIAKPKHAADMTLEDLRKHAASKGIADAASKGRGKLLAELATSDAVPPAAPVGQKGA